MAASVHPGGGAIGQHTVSTSESVRLWVSSPDPGPSILSAQFRARGPDQPVILLAKAAECNPGMLGGERLIADCYRNISQYATAVASGCSTDAPYVGRERFYECARRLAGQLAEKTTAALVCRSRPVYSSQSGRDSGIPVILAAPVFIVSGLGSGRQAVYGDLISRLVDKHPGRYSDSMGVLHRAEFMAPGTRSLTAVPTAVPRRLAITARSPRARPGDEHVSGKH